MEPSWHQNPSKIGISCEKAFFEKTMFFLRKNNVFSKKAFSQLIPIFNGFWCQLGSIFPPKIHQNSSKNRSQDASNFWSIFASIFSPFWLQLGTQLGAMLATFSEKIGGRNRLYPLCYYVGVFLRFFSPSALFAPPNHPCNTLQTTPAIPCKPPLQYPAIPLQSPCKLILVLFSAVLF